MLKVTIQCGSTARREELPVLQLVGAIKRCTKVGDLEAGKKLHHLALSTGIHTNKYIAAVLITMYSKCREMVLAHHVFYSVSNKNVVLWTALIQGYVENGESSKALELFALMDCEANSFTYVAVLKAYKILVLNGDLTKCICVERGLAIWKQVKEKGIDLNVIVANSLIELFGKCNNVNLAREVFNGMAYKDVVSWTSLILGYVDNGQHGCAVYLFSLMDCNPNSLTFVAVLKACGGLTDEAGKEACMENGILIHGQARDAGCDKDMVVETTLVYMYSKCGSMRRARDVFDGMIRRDAAAWNCLILGYVDNGEPSLALDAFYTMDCKPSSVTFVSVLKACGALARDASRTFVLEHGLEVHKHAVDLGLGWNVPVATALVEMCSKCGDLQRARAFFDRMAARNVVSWTCLMQGYIDNGESLAALDLFFDMDCEPDSYAYVVALKACGFLASRNVSDKDTFLGRGGELQKRLTEQGLGSNVLVENALVEMYAKGGCMHLARKVFEGMVLKDVTTWNSVISGYVERGESLTALELFERMDCQPNVCTYLAALKACRCSAALSHGKLVHGSLCKLGLEEDLAVVTSLMDLYCKFGIMSTFEVLFYSLRCPDILSWNALITGYSSLGDSCRVLSSAEKILELGLRMDSVTFLCVLTACNHGGLFEESRFYFAYMLRKGIILSVEHFNSMIDMFARADRLEEALALVEAMPFEANGVTWITLLAASRKRKNVQVGRVAFDELVASETHQAAAYLMMREII